MVCTTCHLLCPTINRRRRPDRGQRDTLLKPAMLTARCLRILRNASIHQVCLVYVLFLGRSSETKALCPFLLLTELHSNLDRNPRCDQLLLLSGARAHQAPKIFAEPKMSSVSYRCVHPLSFSLLTLLQIETNMLRFTNGATSTSQQCTASLWLCPASVVLLWLPWSEVTPLPEASP